MRDGAARNDAQHANDGIRRRREGPRSARFRMRRCRPLRRHTRDVIDFPFRKPSALRRRVGFAVEAPATRRTSSQTSPFFLVATREVYQRAVLGSGAQEAGVIAGVESGRRHANFGDKLFRRQCGDEVVEDEILDLEDTAALSRCAVRPRLRAPSGNWADRLRDRHSRDCRRSCLGCALAGSQAAMPCRPASENVCAQAQNARASACFVNAPMRSPELVVVGDAAQLTDTLRAK